MLIAVRSVAQETVLIQSSVVLFGHPSANVRRCELIGKIILDETLQNVSEIIGNFSTRL